MYEVRSVDAGRPVHVLHETLLHLQVGNPLTAFVPVHEAVEAHGVVGKYERAERNLRLYCSAGPQTDDAQCLVLRLDLAGAEVHIGKGIEFRHHDVDVVRSYAVGKNGEPCSFVLTCDPGEFAGLSFSLDRVEMWFEHGNASRVSYQDDAVG